MLKTPFKTSAFGSSQRAKRRNERPPVGIGRQFAILSEESAVGWIQMSILPSGLNARLRVKLLIL